MSTAPSPSPPPSISHTSVPMVDVSAQRQGGRQARRLRSRLRAIASILALALLLLLVRTPLVNPPGYLGVQVTALIVIGMLLMLLYSSVVLDRAQLRSVEVVMLATATLRFAVHSYLIVRDRVIAGDQLLALGELYSMALSFGALIILYGLLAPDRWQRTLALITPMALAPAGMLLAMRGLEPGAFAGVLELAEFETVSNLVVQILVAALVAVAGSKIMHSLRKEANDALEFGQYQLQERIATGGMGEIWRARHRFLARPAAVKVIHADKVDPLDPVAAAVVLHRFEREAQATAALESAHTVRIYDFGRTQEGNFYYAMELLDGFDLESLVARHGPLRPERAIHYLLQACDSLAEAHERGQVHRDVKPSNLFACKVGRAFDVLKVLDFGLVTRSGAEQARDMRLAEGQEMVGTPAYMAPEQVLAVTRIDTRVDIYALGCVAYWLLTGHTVFDIDRPLAMAVAHVKARPMPPSRRTETHIPEDLERLVLWCLEKDPDDRPPSAEELADRLAACDGHGAWTQASARTWWQQHGPAAPIA